MEETHPGLSSERARDLLERSGPNTISEHEESIWSRLIKKFWAPVPWMLEITVVLETLLGRWIESIIILVVLVFNSALGITQELRAKSALQLLRSQLEISARIRRDGIWQLIPAAEVVPGDIAHVRVGDFVPADLILFDGDVMIDQSALTGESSSVSRKPGQIVYSGSTVVGGEASGEVTATGVNSYFGRTAELVRQAGTSGHLDRVVLQMVRMFIILDLLLAAAGTYWLAVGGAPASEIISLAVVLLLASVPVALPAAFALSAALAAQHLAHLGILTSRLTAVQDASAMDVLCIDKTGTITQNRLTVTEVTSRRPFQPDQVLSMAVEASDEATQDPIDLAIIAAAKERGCQPMHVRQAFTPFDPATKRSSATVMSDAGVLSVSKGAPQVIAAMANDSTDDELERLAASGARVLAIALTDPEGNWHQAGLVALEDPPRPDAANLIQELNDLGVRVVMLTGDNLLTAKAIASRVGIDGPSVRAAEISTQQSRLEFAVVAELLPEDKYHIVRHLQEMGHVVGMTGDGVNDAPALRQAELGVATAGATDVAKSAAGVVLTGTGLAPLARLVQESRKEHQRSVTYALNVAIKKIQVPFLVTIGVFAWREFIFTPLLMALLLLGNDVASMSIMTDNVPFSKTPDTWNMQRFLIGSTLLALAQLALSVAVLWFVRDIWPVLSLSPLRTVTFLILVVGSQSNIYLVRTPNHLWTSKPGSWLAITSAVDALIAISLAISGILMTAVSPSTAGAVIAAILIGTVLTDLLKVPIFGVLNIHRT